MDITVDVTSPTPPYEQIRAQVAGFIANGLLLAGARLPTMRALAADLGVAVGTVARAYRELEAGGLVASRRRTGTVVTGSPTAPTPPAAVREAADELAARATRAELDEETTVAVLRAAFAKASRA
ncbi:GntR family transcriptional regulator [Modestobacter italicus]|uniref:GntR family transcriptional regulator n=1 Tax=Modestobacter italicus (strain DSM 44449 / CECT 9708 / BC 501) TaxID=2732864 RepID=UPI0027E06BAF|nr:GntR family transcriptional regulator [Modestobacter italicus]